MKKLVTCLAVTLALYAMPVNASVIYSSMPSPYPSNVDSWAYEANSFSELGRQIQFAGTERNLSTVTVGLSDWARYENWVSQYPSGSYSHDFTLNLYNVGATGSYTPGSLISTLTTTASVPLRPTDWSPQNGGGVNGILFNVTFDFSQLGVTLPDQIVYGLAYNTQNHGPNPLGVNGPYNSLNFGLNTAGPSIGSDGNQNLAYVNSPANWYTDGGAAGANIFRLDSGYVFDGINYGTPIIEFNASAPVPEPGTFALLGFGLVGLGAMARRRNKKA